MAVRKIGYACTGRIGGAAATDVDTADRRPVRSEEGEGQQSDNGPAAQKRQEARDAAELREEAATERGAPTGEDREWPNGTLRSRVNTEKHQHR